MGELEQTLLIKSQLADERKELLKLKEQTKDYADILALAEEQMKDIARLQAEKDALILKLDEFRAKEQKLDELIKRYELMIKIATRT
jgi:septal ring factor EnvC (AmiA/AmiB activator)